MLITVLISYFNYTYANKTQLHTSAIYKQRGARNVYCTFKVTRYYYFHWMIVLVSKFIRCHPPARKRPWHTKVNKWVLCDDSWYCISCILAWLERCSYQLEIRTKLPNFIAHHYSLALPPELLYNCLHSWYQRHLPKLKYYGFWVLFSIQENKIINKN